MKARLIRLLRNGGLLLALGLGYALWIRQTGLGLSCPIYRLTGLQCPGCGVTRMCLALLRLDFAAAWQFNPGLMLALPLLGILTVRLAVRYVRVGSLLPTRGERICLWGLVVWFVLWAVWRNLVLG